MKIFRCLLLTAALGLGTSELCRSGVEALPTAGSIGKRVFFDVSLSASGQLACVSCHDPRYAYAAPNDQAVQTGGADMHQSGTRASPSLRYTLRSTPNWSHEFQADPVEQMLDIDATPIGGFDWDGRFDTLRAQAESAFLAANQMANENRAVFAQRLARTDYADAFRAVFGPDVFADADRVFAMAALAVERFELEDLSFHPFSSRYDEFLEGKQTLSRRETRGLTLFLAPNKGNCASCHSAARGADGSHPLFTDFSFQVLGVPRNADIPANRTARYFDLGLCGPQRIDLAETRAYCGMFKTPTLRNVSTRRVFFHNGKFRSLREVLRFYVTREHNAQHWYPGGTNPKKRYDDMPADLRGNVDRFNAPFNRREAEASALSEAEISELIAFLATLTDQDTETPPSSAVVTQHR